jgi:hypothetical protein
MRHFIAFAARRVNFIGYEGNGPVEFTDRLDDGKKFILSGQQFLNGYNVIRTSRLERPVWFSLFVKGGDALLGFSRFPGLHVILESKINIFFHRC